MGYLPFLISTFETGIDQSRKPWMIPEDAFPEILDGYNFRGVLTKREGYSGFANGLLSTYCESRMVHHITNEAYRLGFGTVGPYNRTLLNSPIRRGTVQITDTVGVQTVTDDGEGVLSGDGTGTINYTTGATSVTFNVAVGGGNPIVATYDYHQGLPLLGIMSFYKSDNSRELIVADTTYVNRYNPVTDRLDDITVTPFVPGDNSNFWSWVNYPDADDVNRLLFVNNKVQIQRYYAGASPLVDPYPVYTTATVVAGGAYNTGNGTTGPYTPAAPLTVPIVPRTVTITDVTGAQTLRDNGEGIFTGAGSGTIDYATGTTSVDFTANVGAGNAIIITYTYVENPIETALQIFDFQDRLVILRPTYTGGTVFPRRIQISGTGAFSDYFVGQAPGAGFIDIPSD